MWDVCVRVHKFVWMKKEAGGCSIYLSAYRLHPVPTSIHSHPCHPHHTNTNTQPPLHYHQLDRATGRLQTHGLLPSSDNDPEWPLSSVEMGVAALPPGEDVVAVAYPDPLEVRTVCLWGSISTEMPMCIACVEWLEQSNTHTHTHILTRTHTHTLSQTLSLSHTHINQHKKADDRLPRAHPGRPRAPPQAPQPPHGRHRLFGVGARCFSKWDGRCVRVYTHVCVCLWVA